MSYYNNYNNNQQQQQSSSRPYGAYHNTNFQQTRSVPYSNPNQWSSNTTTSHSATGSNASANDNANVNSNRNVNANQSRMAPHSGNMISMNNNLSDGNFQQQQQQQSNTSQTAPSSNNASNIQSTAAAAPQLWNPATINSMMKNDVVMNLAYDSGTKFLASGAARMVPGLELFMSSMRAYFAVDNAYVMSKIQRVLFPFLKKDWKRMEAQGQQGSMRFALPRFDVNAPDLYIPVMSLVTYVLLCGLLFGSKGQFTPEALPEISSRCFVTQILEVIAIRFGHYVMQVPCSFIDLFCFTGYKYLGLCINMLVGLCFGYWSFYGTMLWTATATAFFMLRTMSNNIPRITASAGPKREIMVFVFAASQAVTMWWLSQTKLLDD